MMRSKVNVVGNGCQEQMLDKLHTDLYFDSEHFVCVDTDRKPVRDLAGKMWMQDGVTPVIGESETLKHELRCLGEDIPRAATQHRSTRQRNQAMQGRERRKEEKGEKEEKEGGTEGRSGRERPRRKTKG